MLESVLESWRYNQQMNRKLLEAIHEEWLTDRATPRGRNVREQIAHIHNVRCTWMEVKSIPMECKKIPRQAELSISELVNQMELSAESMTKLLGRIEDGFKAKGKKVDLTRFFTYLIAHEAHHRGQIILHLKLCGHALPQDVKYGLWDL